MKTITKRIIDVCNFNCCMSYLLFPLPFPYSTPLPTPYLYLPILSSAFSLPLSSVLHSLLFLLILLFPSRRALEQLNYLGALDDDGVLTALGACDILLLSCPHFPPHFSSHTPASFSLLKHRLPNIQPHHIYVTSLTILALHRPQDDRTPP